MARKPTHVQRQFDFTAKPVEPDETPSFVERVNRPEPAPTHVAGLKQRSLFDMPPPPPPDVAMSNGHHETPVILPAPSDPVDQPLSFDLAPGEKAKAHDIITAIRTLKQVEEENRPATPEEKQGLARFCGFGPVALSIFPNPVTDEYKDGWHEVGEELRSLLTAEEYASARASTYNAFYTSPIVIKAMHEGLTRLGVSPGSVVLEPGAGVGRFITPNHRFIGVELDSISGRIARLLHPGQDIRIENFRDSRLPELDAVIGNVPFADLKMEHRGQKFSLHDFFFAKATDSLKPGGVLALVTSHFTMDKQNAAIREYLAERADFLGAIRLPSDAFKREGTSVVTDIVFLRKRALGQDANHADLEWLSVEPMEIEGAEIPINRYFINHPEMVLGQWSRKDTLYGEGYSVLGQGDLAGRIREAVERLPESIGSAPIQFHSQLNQSPSQPAVPSQLHITEGSFFIDDHRVIRQIIDGQAQLVIYGGKQLTAGGGLLGKRFGHLIELRDHARRVLLSQNEGWPETDRQRSPSRTELVLRPLRRRVWPHQQNHLRRDQGRYSNPPDAEHREIQG